MDGFPASIPLIPPAARDSGCLSFPSRACGSGPNRTPAPSGGVRGGLAHALNDWTLATPSVLVVVGTDTLSLSLSLKLYLSLSLHSRLDCTPNDPATGHSHAFRPHGGFVLVFSCFFERLATVPAIPTYAPSASAAPR